jgi:alpha-mannosidase
MLKHPDLTRRRIEMFLRHDLEPRVLGEREPLRIEMLGGTADNAASAANGPWREIPVGHRYGPAYRSFWFRVTGTVPERFAGKPLVVVPELGGERTVWRDNSPWRGVDGPHSHFDWSLGAGSRGREVPAEGGERLEYLVQAYSGNPQCRVHLCELPREELVETVEGAWLAVSNPAVRDLTYDVDFALSLLDTIDEGDPARAHLLRALNDVVNTFRPETPESIARCRRMIRDVMGTLDGEVSHRIVPVGHAHLDTAWLWPIDITKKKMAHTTATQLGLLERYPDYVFVHSQASQYEWLEKEYPELFERVKAMVARGRWEPVGSMWVEADCNLSGGEALVRQFLYGRRYFREKLNYETHDMWLPDVFGYAASLPQILQKFNIEAFLTQKISWNQFNVFPHHTFWWQGIDGSRIWTHFPPADTYCASAEPKEVLKSVRAFRDHGRSDTSLYVFGFGDGGGGPTERHLEFLKRGRLAPNYPEVALGTRAIDFFREAKKESRDLMTWVGELYLEYHRGTYTSQAENKRANRKSEFLLRDAELLSCFAPGFPRDYPAEDLEAAWKLVLLNQFHDIIPGSSVREVYEDSDRDYAKVFEEGERIVQEKLLEIAKAFDTSEMTRPVALFQNASMVCQAEIPWPDEAAPQSLSTADDSLPVQLVEEFGERKLIFAAPPAALGAVTVAELGDGAPAGKSRLKSSSRRIENSELSVRFDAHGNITSIQSLEDGTEFLEPGAVGNLFQLLDDKPLYWSAWDTEVYSHETAQDLLRSESFEIVERGPVRVAAEVVKRFGSSTIRQRISLGPTPGVRFDTEVEWHEQDKMLKVAFPVNVNAARATCEIQFGHVERATHRNTTWDMAKFEVCAHKWVDLSEGDMGVALLNDCKYGHDLNGNVVRLSLLRAPKAPDPMCDMGRHRFAYALVPHFGPFNYSGIVQAAYAFNTPVRHAFLTPGTGEQGSLPPFVSCDDRNVVVEAVKKAEDSDDLIVRLYECHNCRGRAELFCAKTPRAAVLCDLEENELAELDVHDGMVAFEYRPFEILTIRLKR